ncbi:MAG: hypothetical protein E6I99_00810 [Chloroflexi bacterium]|nr:MAG: hypothetical protein E6I99_00810 [Chloroflexota bacterium]
MQGNGVFSRLIDAHPAYQVVVNTDPHLNVEGSLLNGVRKRRSQAWIHQSRGLLGDQPGRIDFHCVLVDSDAGDGRVSKVPGRKRAPQELQGPERVNGEQVLRIFRFAPSRRHGSAEIDVDAILFVDDSLYGDELHLGVDVRT